MTYSPPLGVNVFRSPEKAVVGERPRPFGPPVAWDPTTSTLTFGERAAVLVDTLTAVADRLAALGPPLAVAGYKKPGAPDTPAAIETTKQDLADLGRLKEKAPSDEELFDRITELYPGWVSLQALLMFGLNFTSAVRE